MDRAAILAYHSIEDSGSLLSVSPQQFSEHLRILKNGSVKVVGVDEILHDGVSDGHRIAITFDDGFRSVYEYAFPLLRRYEFPATIFLVTDYCGKTNSWPSQPAWALKAPLLDWPEIREMSAGGITFGSHTRTHPDLRTLGGTDTDSEVAVSKQVIEDATGRKVCGLAYPYGAYDERVTQVAQAHYDWACTTDLAFLGARSDPFTIPRLDAYYIKRTAIFDRLFSPPAHAYVAARRWLRGLRQHCRLV